MELSEKESKELDNYIKEIYSKPLEFYDPGVEMLKNAYTSGIINQHMLRAALDRNEITLKEYVKIINK